MRRGAAARPRTGAGVGTWRSPPSVHSRRCANLPAMTDFTGKAALVTGGTRGIGLGIAQEIVDHGGSVCITARKPDELEQAVKTLDPDGTGRAISARGSADDEAHQQEAVEQTVATFGRLDFLVNNAAVNPYYGATVDADLGAVRKILEVNVVAVLGW